MSKLKQNLPAGWEIKKLGEVCKLIGGGTPSKKNEKFYTGNIYWATVRDMKVDIITDTELKITNEAVLKSSTNIIPKGNVIIATRVGLGKVCFIENDTAINQDLKGVIPKNQKQLSVEFLFRWFKRISNKIIDEGTGATVQGVKLSFINSLEIPLPPLPEQQRIVAILDKAFAAIDKAKANAEQNLKNAKELFESYLQGVFKNKGDEWEEKTLGEVAFVKSGGTPSRAKKEYWEGDIAWYSSGELNDLFTIAPKRHINELAINNSNAKIFPKGSLLIGMYDTAALKMSIIDREATFNQAIAGVKPNDKIDLIFVLHSINSIKPDILNLRRGVRQKNLNLSKIKNIPISLPTIFEQQTIVKKLDSLSVKKNRLEAIYQKKINNLDELKKSILQKAFEGEL